MKNLIITLSLCAFAITANAQDFSKLVAKGFGAQNTKMALAKDSLSATAAPSDTVPTFPGGDMFLEAYIQKKIEQIDVKGKGEVVVSFNVDKKGYIYGAEVTKSAGNALDTEAFNIVTSMPKWRPARKDGNPIDHSASVTIKFGE